MRVINNKKGWQFRKDLTDSYCNAVFPKVGIINTSNGRESIKHLVIKTIVMHILRQKHHEACSEVIINGKIADVIDCDSRDIYEIETNLTEEGRIEKRGDFENNFIHEIIFIDLKKLPEDINLIYEILKEKVDNCSSD